MLLENYGDVFYYIPAFPSDPGDYIEFNFDYITQNPDTYETLLYGSSFEYQGHVWNSVLNYQADGDILNVSPNSGRLQQLLSQQEVSMDHTVWLLPGDNLRNVYCDTHCKSGKDTLYYTMMQPLFWDESMYGWHQFQITWFRIIDSEGHSHFSNAYGDILSSAPWPYYTDHVFWSCAYNKSTGRWTERSQTLLYSKDGERNRGIYTPAGYDNTYLTLSANDTADTVLDKLRAKVRDSSYYVRHNLGTVRPTWYWYYVNWSVEVLSYDSTIDPQLTAPNYQVIFSDYDSIRNVNWHTIADSAYQSLGVADINGIANLKELAEMGSTVLGFIDTLKSLPSKKVKAAASAWLAIHYGFKLTILDAKELREVLHKFSERRSNLSKAQATSESTNDFGITYRYRYQVFYDQFAQLDSLLEEFLAISDSYISLENSWDMVPWSFVIDWFVQIGDWFQSLDNYLNLKQRHRVICTGRSVEASFTALPSQLGLFSGVGKDASLGCITLKFYKRIYSPYLVKPSSLPSVSINILDHWFEVAALYISIV